jgi:putative tryptophan/tyrosine transport system substrate-binding protein
MSKLYRLQFFDSESDKRKSKTCTEFRRSIHNLECGWILAIAVAFAMCGAVAEAQQQAKVAKIGWLGSGSSSGPGGNRVVFQQVLREIGYDEGKNIVFEHRFAEGKLDRLPALADELVRLKVDVILTSSTNEALAAKNATRTIPIVFLGGGDPVIDGLVDSLARPGTNITGVTNIAPVLVGKRLELLKETIPKLFRVAVLWDPQGPSSVQQWKESQLPARELGLHLRSMEIRNANDFENAFKETTKAGSAALAVTSSRFINSYFKEIVGLARKNRLAAIGARGDFAESGGLMSYGADQGELFRRAAVFVAKILKGAKPADLPVEQPKKFEFIINLKAAKQIGPTIPPNVLVRADRIIK